MRSVHRGKKLFRVLVALIGLHIGRPLLLAQEESKLAAGAKSRTRPNDDSGLKLRQVRPVNRVAGEKVEQRFFQSKSTFVDCDITVPQNLFRVPKLTSLTGCVC